MASNLIRLSPLLNDPKCSDRFRQHRWPNSMRCLSCDSGYVVRNGWDVARQARQSWLRCIPMMNQILRSVSEAREESGGVEMSDTVTGRSRSTEMVSPRHPAGDRLGRHELA
jgi:hypothetical protein